MLHSEDPAVLHIFKRLDVELAAHVSFWIYLWASWSAKPPKS